MYFFARYVSQDLLNDYYIDSQNGYWILHQNQEQTLPIPYPSHKQNDPNCSLYTDSCNGVAGNAATAMVLHIPVAPGNYTRQHHPLFSDSESSSYYFEVPGSRKIRPIRS